MTTESPGDGWGRVAAPLGWAYGTAVTLRNYLYDTKRRAVRELPVPVISIGNVTVGGTGKTPYTRELARVLGGDGWLPCILSRGYGGTRPAAPMIVSDHARILHGPSEAGDEPHLLARMLPGVPVVVGADRFAAAQHALSTLPLHLFLLDDGFQHRGLRRDVDIVLLDAVDPWGGGRMLPAGRLREPLSGLRRATAIVLTRLHQAEPTWVARVREELQRRLPRTPVLGTRTLATGFRNVNTGELMGAHALGRVRVVAFAGIARPGSFFFDLEHVGAQIVARRTFRDHHPFTAEEARDLMRLAESTHAAALVTTEKDAMRWPGFVRGGVPIFAFRTRLLPQDDEELLRLVSRYLPPPSRGGRAI